MLIQCGQCNVMGNGSKQRIDAMDREGTNSKRTDVFLLELPRFVPLHECGLADTAIANQDQFELWDVVELVVILRQMERRTASESESPLSEYQSEPESHSLKRWFIPLRIQPHPVPVRAQTIANCKEIRSESTP